MSETLLSPSEIKLYGRLVGGLYIFGPATTAAGAGGAVQAARHWLIGPPPHPTATGQDVRNRAAHYRDNLALPAHISEYLGANEVVSVMDDFMRFNYAATAADVIAAGSAATFNYSYGDNKFLEKQLNQNPRLARIYSFSFEGAYYEIPKPAIFLVEGFGLPVMSGYYDWTDLDTTGVMARPWEFSSRATGPGGTYPIANDIRYWNYDRGDFSIRMDVEAGQFWQILLEDAMRRGTALTSGEQLRITSGEQLRVGGDMRKRWP
jgi:hypothetical protein